MRPHLLGRDMPDGAVSFFVPHSGCSHMCSFCDQRTVSGEAEPPTSEDIRKILRAAIKQHGAAAKGMQVAFFGGSFMAIESRQLHLYLRAALLFCGEDGFSGIRISTRPDSVTPGILRELEQYPIEDIELGAQSMNDDVLQKNNRGHTARDTAEAARLIQSAGYRLTLQMMTGLPGDTPGGTSETAWKIAEMRPDAVRIYPTIVLNGTTLADWYLSGEYHPPQFDDAVEQCAHLLEFFTRQDIPVIRLGLHETEGLRRNYIAGPYHPAFRELCEGSVMFEKLVPLVEALPPGVIYIKVHPKSISVLTGHGRRVLLPLEQAGYTPIVMPDDNLGYLEVKVTN